MKRFDVPLIPPNYFQPHYPPVDIGVNPTMGEVATKMQNSKDGLRNRNGGGASSFEELVVIGLRVATIRKSTFLLAAESGDGQYDWEPWQPPHFSPTDWLKITIHI